MPAKVPEREAAKAAGERFYFTGKPCKNGHVVKRYTGTGLCSRCATINTLRCQAKGREHPNRTAARLAGETHYPIGRSCKHGHSDKYYVSNQRCFECDIVRTKKYHGERPGIGAKWARELRAKDPTGHRKASGKWAKQNPDKNKAIKGRCIARNPDLWRKRFVAYSQNRKARETENGGSFTDTDIDAMRAEQNGKCNACKEERKLEVDHVVAVVNGGSNDPSNLQLLCARCNKSKGRRDYEVWLAEQVFDLPVENAA